MRPIIYAIITIAILVALYVLWPREFAALERDVLSALGDECASSRLLMSYQKTYGPFGRIYSLNIMPDGRYEITSLGAGDAMPHAQLVRSGRLTHSQMAAARRLSMMKFRPCPVTPTGADSITSRIVCGCRSVELGVLALDLMPPQTSYDVASMEMLLGDWRKDMVLP
jgi:hypothetical protein